MMFTVNLMNANTLMFDTAVKFYELSEAIKFIKTHRFTYAVLCGFDGAKIAAYKLGQLDAFNIDYVDILL